MSKRNHKFNAYIYKLLREKVSPDEEYGFTGDAIMTLNNMVSIIVHRFMNAMNVITNSRSPPSKILKQYHIKAALDLVINDLEFLDELREAGNEALKNFESNVNAEGERSYRHERAGLIFSVSRVENLMLENCVTKSKAKSVAVFLTAVVEAIVERTLVFAKEVTVKHKKKRITVDHICSAISSNQELDSIFYNSVLGGGLYLHQYSLSHDPEVEDAA